MDQKVARKLEKRIREHVAVMDIQAIFFEAMLAGYAASGKLKKGTIAELPGSKLVPPYVRGPWKVTDPYLVSPVSAGSSGMTVISYDDVPVWMMTYQGEYDKKVIPCLKAALHAAYASNTFFGCRGPRRFTHGNYVYLNVVDRVNNDFSRLFRGMEWIDTLGGKERGWHAYQGGSLL